MNKRVFCHLQPHPPILLSKGEIFKLKVFIGTIMFLLKIFGAGLFVSQNDHCIKLYNWIWTFRNLNIVAYATVQ